MAVSTVPRPGAIAAVLAKASRWTSARRKSDGKPFFIVPGSTAGATYYTAEDGCTCPSASDPRRDGDCKHQVAIRQHQERQAKRLGLANPAESDLAFAEVGTRLRGDQAGAAITYGPCISKSGCDQPAGGKSRLCGQHLDALVASLGA
jgi:hypothetical protein